MICDNVKRVFDKMEKAASLSGRSLDDITLVGVTKTVTAKEARELMDAGVKNLGENRVQSLLDKYDVLKDEPVWHLIGHLQTNKVKYIADKVSMIHSVDSVKLAEEIDRRCAPLGKVMDILIEINSGEENKDGIEPSEAFSVIEEVSKLKNVRIKGLMTMAPIYAPEETLKKVFSDLYKLSVDISSKRYDNVSMECLSMGMSGDYEEAVRQGATIIRPGRTLFNTK